MSSKRLVSLTLLFMLILVLPVFAKEQKMTSTQWFIIGDGYMNKKDYEKAIYAFSNAIEINDAAPEAIQGIYWFRGTAFDNQKKYGLAIKDFTKSIELGYSNEISVIAYNRRGWIYYKLSKDDLAIDDYNMAIKIDPKYAVAYNNRGLVYERKDQYALALKDYEKAIELNNSRNAMQYAYTNRAFWYLRSEQYDLAIADCNKAIEINPEPAYPYFIKAEALAFLGKKQEALEEVSKFESKEW
jgi:tetratricopeptide (TPR) repeat protein